MSTETDYLAAYDAQLRTDAETPSAVRVERLGPFRLVTFAGGRGFVTYRDLAGPTPRRSPAWVAQASTTTGPTPRSTGSSGRRADMIMLRGCTTRYRARLRA